MTLFSSFHDTLYEESKNWHMTKESPSETFATLFLVAWLE